MGMRKTELIFDKNRLSQNMKNLRLQRDIRQEDLAINLGVHHKIYSRWERCEVVPKIVFLVKFANYFKVTVDQLLFDKL